MGVKRWVYHKPDLSKVNKIYHDFGISKLIGAILVNRGLTEKDEIERYLQKNLAVMHDPFLMKDMDKAIERIKYAFEKEEKITVYGDYDVDGVTSTAILVKYLRKCNAEVDYYIPDRIDEGYGINNGALDKIKNNGTSLVITVDSGITAVDEIEYASTIGLDVIVTDHHQCKDILPQACAVLNPKISDGMYPFTELAGVGVAFKLIQALAGMENIETLFREYCDIVCLGTIADVVPLVDENRVIVDKGLELISETSNVGLKSLVKLAALKDKKVTAGTVGFIIAPRINAAGRIGNALRAVELFLTEDEAVADAIASELNEENKNRQATEACILQEALTHVQEQYDLENNKVIVLANEDWHHGVIGIVASRITEKFYRPSILISLEGDSGKGSGRSIKGFNLFEALKDSSDYLLKYGGHSLAAGLSISRDKIPEFLEKINTFANQCLCEDDLIAPIYIDYVLSRQDISIGTIKQLNILEPFGMGNASPVFAVCDALILDIRTISDGKHIKLTLKKDEGFIEAIGFNMGEAADRFITGDSVDVACSLDINNYNGVEKVQLVIKDLKLPDQSIIEHTYYKTFDSALINDIISNKTHFYCDIAGEPASSQLLNQAFSKMLSEKRQISDIVDQCNMGNNILVLINTLEGAQSILREMEQLNTDCIKYHIHYNHVSRSTNCDLLINPTYSQIAYKNYDCIYLYDHCFNIADMSLLVHGALDLKFIHDNNRIHWSDKAFKEMIPERQHLVIVYQYIKTRSQDGCYEDNALLLSRRISRSYNVNMNYYKFIKSMEVFREMKLLDFKMNEDKIVVRMYEHQGEKIRIENSKILLDLKELKNKYEEFKNLFHCS